MNLKNGVLVSTLFEDFPVIHGFTTRAYGNLGFGKKPGDPEVITNRQKLFEAQDLSSRNHIQPKQVHSSRWISASDFVSGVEADATFSKSPKEFLSILTADCLPLLVYHPEGTVAAIHAGWRGLYDGIVPATFTAFSTGAFVAVGPSIGPCCYEVSDDLASDFEKKFGAEVIVRQEDWKKPHLDLRQAVILQLQQAGVEAMDICQICTSCHADLFFSYRRDGSSGRMMSWIALE